MARKHNTKHRRGQSRYPDRLRARGLSRTPLMRWTGSTTEAIVRDLTTMRDNDRVGPDRGYHR